MVIFKQFYIYKSAIYKIEVAWIFTEWSLTKKIKTKLISWEPFTIYILTLIGMRGDTFPSLFFLD